MKEIEVKWENMKEIISKEKKRLLALTKGNKIDFVGMKLYFVVDDELLTDYGIFSKDFNLDDWE